MIPVKLSRFGLFPRSYKHSLPEYVVRWRSDTLVSMQCCLAYGAHTRSTFTGSDSAGATPARSEAGSAQGMTMMKNNKNMHNSRARGAKKALERPHSSGSTTTPVDETILNGNADDADDVAGGRRRIMASARRKNSASTGGTRAI